MKRRFDAAEAVFIAENGGLSAAEMAAFRREMKAGGGRAQVVKNTLAKRAFTGGKYESLAGSLSGALIFGDAEDPTAGAKAFSNAAKANDKFILRGGALAGGTPLDKAAIIRLAAIPGREQLLSNLLGAMRAPAAAAARTLNEIPARFARLIAILRDRKSGADGA